MKPITRWLVFGGIGVAAGVALSLVALRDSPISAPRTGDAVPEQAALPGAGGAPAAIADAGEAPRTSQGITEIQLNFQPVPAEDLRDPETSFQLVLLPLQRSRVSPQERVTALARKVFPGLKVQRSDRPVTARPAVLVGELNAPGISAGELELFGRGLSAQQQSDLGRTIRATVLEFHLARERPLAQLRQVEALAAAVAEQAGAVLYDVETREYFSTRAWRERRVEGWSGDFPQVPTEIAIVTHPSAGERRSLTYGMAKFGLPDLVLPRHGTEEGFSKAMATVLTLTAQLLVEKGRVDSAGQLRIRIDDVQHPGVRAELRAMKRGNARGETQLNLGVAKPMDNDPANRLLEVVFAPGEDGQRAMQQAISDLFGP